MEHVAQELGLSLYRVSARHAREHRVPGSLPYHGQGATVEHVIAGLEKLLRVNDRLTSYSDYLSMLKASGERSLPPAASLPPPDVH